MLLRKLSVAAALEAAAFGGPVHEPLHVFAVFPGQVEELAWSQIGRFFSKKSLKPPAHVGTLPRFQPVTAGCIPVILQRLEHALRPSECFAQLLLTR